MGVVNEDTEAVLLLQGHDAGEVAQSACHAINALGDDKNAATRLGHHFSSDLKFLLKVCHVIVAVLVLVANMQTDTVKQTSMCFVVINNDIVHCGQRVDGRNNTLIAKVEEVSGFFLFKVSQLMLEMLVHACMASHHTGAHGSCKTVFGSGFSIHATNLGVVG